MSSDPQDDKTARDALREVLASAPVQFWICPVEAHHHDYPEPPREIVRWIGDVAHCMEPGCGRTSADPVRPQETPRERVAQALHDWRCLRACKGYEYHSEETKNFYRNEADGVLPIVEEETARQLSALRDKVKARAKRYDEIGGSIDCAEPLPCAGCDYALIAADLRALVEEPQGGER